jgi:hypothetical protein
MKIRNEQQLRALREAEARNLKKARPDEAFDRLLNREVRKDAARQTAESALSPRTMPSAALLGASTAAGGAAPVFGPEAVESAAQEMEGMFDTLDSYAGQLALDGKADLRQAYALLESLAGRIADFKTRHMTAGAQAPLSSLLNELEVLTTTETIKFNRGDYL